MPHIPGHKKKKEEREIKRVEQPGTARPGTSPDIRTTIQGDTFDVNLPIIRENFSSIESFKQAKATKETGAGGILPGGLGATPERLAKREQLQKEQQEEQAREEIGAQPLIEELEQQILEPPSLEPEPIAERAAKAGLQIPAAAGNLITQLAEQVTGKQFGRQTAKDLAKTKAGKALGIATLGTGIALAGAAAAPYVVQAAARSAIFNAVLGSGGSVPFLRTAIEGVALFAVGKGVFDFRGDEMDVLRQGIKKVVEDGERIEAAVRNGFPNTDSLQLLTTMADEVAFAESRIKELGNNNIEYRVSKEYILDAQNVRSAREALVRRVRAVENIALTGQAALNPEELMYTASRFK